MVRLSALLGLLALPPALAAQTLAQRIAATAEGTVRLSFAARPGVCSSGEHNITITSDEEGGEWESDCRSGPVRVSLRMRGGRVSEAHTYVGGRWRPAAGATSDLGTVSAPAAADELLTLAERTADDAEELVTAATLADSAVVWPKLLRLAKQQDVPLDTRKQAVFWLGQAAGEAATRGLDSLTTDEHGELEVRKQAVFALSQRPDDEGVPALIHIARTNPSGELRKTALFWLGQSEDPRALALFEEILR
ncbi:MAG TPA: HEAT repeat domain-containing protein [Candidatus Dormibacteraeota bacterium]|nr:HEAT repeat domain-containing protein [Candidatus Dormibacteraeota bacterium]